MFGIEQTSIKIEHLIPRNIPLSLGWRKLLLLAETYAQQDKTALALPYLNASRLRAGLSAIQLPFQKMMY
jgi:hypothetical protein